MQPSPYRKPNTADRNGVSLPMTDLCRFVWRAPTGADVLEPIPSATL
jgi:hypothetical protein